MSTRRTLNQLQKYSFILIYQNYLAKKRTFISFLLICCIFCSTLRSNSQNYRELSPLSCRLSPTAYRLYPLSVFFVLCSELRTRCFFLFFYAHGRVGRDSFSLYRLSPLPSILSPLSYLLSPISCLLSPVACILLIISHHILVIS